MAEPVLAALRGEPVAGLAGHCRRCARDHTWNNRPDLARAALQDVWRDLTVDRRWPGLGAALLQARGKMVGVLVARDAAGERHTLLAYSGDLAGSAPPAGFVDGVMLRAQVQQLETHTLTAIAGLERALEKSSVAALKEVLTGVEAQVAQRAAQRRAWVLQARQERGLMRRNGVDAAAVAALAEETRLENVRAMAAEAAEVEAARTALRTAEQEDRALRKQRATLSATLMAAMFDVTWLTSARGETRRLADVFVGNGMPSGTGECAVPKLLHHANVRGLRPLAVAEAWWGPVTTERQPGELCAPCARKCQPILGHLLCGLDAP